MTFSTERKATERLVCYEFCGIRVYYKNMHPQYKKQIET